MNSDMEHMKTCRTTYTSLKYSIRELKTITYIKYLFFFLIWRKNEDPTYVFYNIKQGSSSVLISFPYLIIRLFIHEIYYSNIFNNWSATLYYWTMEKGSIIYLLMTLLPYEFEGLTFLYLVFSIRLVNIRLVITNIIHKDIVNERKRQINTIT